MVAVLYWLAWVVTIACRTTRLLEAPPHLSRAADPPPRRQHLVRQARLLGTLDGLEHPRRVGGEVDLSQRQVLAQNPPGFFLGSRQVVECAHVVIDVPAAMLSFFDRSRVVG